MARTFAPFAFAILGILAAIGVVGTVFVQIAVVPAQQGRRLTLALLESDGLEAARARAGKPERTFTAVEYDALVDHLRNGGYIGERLVPRLEGAVYDLYRIPLSYECVVMVYVDGKRVTAVVLRT